jgi:hypothetical protein
MLNTFLIHVAGIGGLNPGPGEVFVGRKKTRNQRRKAAGTYGLQQTVSVLPYRKGMQVPSRSFAWISFFNPTKAPGNGAS